MPNFLLPAGGALTITGYWHVDVFRPAHLSNIWSLVQIEHSMFEMYKSMTYLLPKGGAMIITEYWPLDVFRPWLIPKMWSLVQIGHCMFKLVLNKSFPVVRRWRYIIMQYWPLDVFRPGLLSNLWSLGQIGHFMAELQQLLFPWRNSVICQAAMDTPFNENSTSSQFNIAKAFRWYRPNIISCH